MILKSQTRLKAAGSLLVSNLVYAVLVCVLFLGLYISLVWRYKVLF
jgi:hypothetical protein